MEEIKQLLKDVIIHDLESCIDDHLQDSIDTEETTKSAFDKRKNVNELLKTLDSIVTHEREAELKSRELEIRANEIKLGVGTEINRLASTAASAGTEIYKTRTGVGLAATAMDFEKGGNMFASQVSRQIPNIISKMVR